MLISGLSSSFWLLTEQDSSGLASGGAGLNISCKPLELFLFLDKENQEVKITLQVR